MLGNKIRELRKQNRYSQEQIARKLGLTQGAISQWENGVTTPISDQLAALSDVLGVTVDELLGRMTEEEMLFGLLLASGNDFNQSKE